MAETTHFDLRTVALLREALDDAWAYLTPKQQEDVPRSLLGQRILKAAAQGERERECLIEAALDEQVGA